MGGLPVTSELITGTPYVGPVPFSSSDHDRERFYGRAREADEVVSFIYSQPQVCVYAASGAGKTSLMNAAVLPILTEHGFDVLPPARVRAALTHGQPNDEITCRYMYEALHSLATREPTETRDVPSHVLFLGTYIDEVHCLLLAPGHHCLESRDVQVSDPIFLRQPGGVGFGCGQPLRRRQW